MGKAGWADKASLFQSFVEPRWSSLVWKEGLLAAYSKIRHQINVISLERYYLSCFVFMLSHILDHYFAF